MSAGSSIQWTHDTFNPWWGCTKISPGCRSCYAATFAHRFGVEWGKGELRRLSSENVWDAPIRWNQQAEKSGERRLVFCASMADIFDDEVPIPWRVSFWDIVRKTKSLTYQILTKRSENFAQFLPRDWGDGWSHVWLGVSVEDRKRLPRIDALRETPAKTRFVSAEPLLEDLGTINLIGIHQVIVGGESGLGARLFNLTWARSIVEQCRHEKIACFVKQLGSNPTKDEIYPSLADKEFPSDVKHQWIGNGSFRPLLKDHKGGDMNEWPMDLRVRQFPGNL